MRAGLNIPDYTLEAESRVHRILHGKGGVVAESWNAEWKALKTANPEATSGEILEFLGELNVRFYLP